MSRDNKHLGIKNLPIRCQRWGQQAPLQKNAVRNNTKRRRKEGETLLKMSLLANNTATVNAALMLLLCQAVLN